MSINLLYNQYSMNKLSNTYVSMYHNLASMGLIPVTTITALSQAVPLAQALAQGDLPCVEITFRSDIAAQAIEKVAKECPEILLGAGTVLSLDNAKQAFDAGAQFIVSPSFNVKVVEYCLSKDIPIIPGTTGSAHIELAMEYNLGVVKFFPADSLGGLSAIHSLANVYPLCFVPSGGINSNNIGEYLRSKYVLALGGSFVSPAKLIQEERFEEITALTKSVITKMLGFSLAHVGINAKGVQDANIISTELEALLGQGISKSSISHFVGTEYEIMFDGLGDNGHLAFGTNSMKVAMRILQARGYTFNENYIRYDDENRLYLAYFNKEIAGFACHLIQNT